MRRKTFAAATAAALSLCIASVSYAIEWPMADSEIAGTFGTLVDGRFLPGIDIEAKDSAVRSAAKGEVVFSYDGDELCAFPSGLGSFAAVAHERGLVSICGGLKEGTVVGYLKDARQGDILALAGAKPDGGETGIRFMLFDLDKGQFVNPLLFLRPREDRKAPSIRAVYVKRDAQAVDLEQTRYLRQGLCEIQAEFWDPRDEGQGFYAPFQVRVLLNGSEKINLSWDIGRERDGRFSLFSGEGKSIQEFFIPPGRFRLGAFPISRGKASLELIVTDFSQKSRSSSFVFQVE